MGHQPNLSWKIRGHLVDWLIEIHSQLRLLPETLFLSVNLVDRFLTARVINKNFRLLCITALFTAAKYEEIMVPTVDNFLDCARCTGTERNTIEAERRLLQAIGWNLSYPSPIHFLRRASKADGMTSTRGRWPST
jgi:G2/mitotic-specific cyclin 1/2